MTIYDAASFEPFLNLAFVAPGIIMIVAAVEALRRPGSWRGLPEPVLRWLYLPFAVLWTAVTAGALFSDAICAAYWARTGQCTVLQGVVQHFRPEPPGGHGHESFDVNGVAFSFSDPIITAGFHFTGPLRQGLPVRICYRGPDILRLEIAEHPETPIRN